VRFINVASYDLHFVVNGVVYDVPVGGECEIEDGQEYVFESRGLPLKRVEATVDAPEFDEEEPKPAPRKVGGKAPRAPKGSKGAKDSKAPPAPPSSPESDAQAPSSDESDDAPESDEGSQPSKE
jgi:hypothetical protein